MKMVNMRGFLLLALLLFLFFYNFSIFQKERFLDRGDVLILELAPVDPRSLMQGDYMVLEFEIERPIRRALNKEYEDLPRNGRVVVLCDKSGKALAARLDDGRPLAPDERFLAYTTEGKRHIKIAGGTFFFEEGLAGLYDHARYALLRVAPDGTAIITGLLDGNKKVLRKERWDAEKRQLREE